MKQNHYLFVVLVVLRIFIQFAPALEYRASLVINFPLLALIYLYIINNAKGNLLNKVFSVIPIFIVPALNMLTVGKVPLINFLYSVFQWISWPLIGFFVVDNLSLKSQRIVLWAFLSCFIITSITTIIGCNMYPSASRALANGNFLESDADIAAMYRSMNIGNFQFVYTLVLMVPLVLCLCNHNLQKKALGYAIVFLFIYTILKTQYTTALILSVVTALYLILPSSHNPRTAKRWFVVLFALALVALPLISGVLQFIASIVGSEQMADRFNELSMSLGGQQLDEESDFGARLYFWSLSFNTFINHFLTGVYFITDVSHRYMYIGGHSFILDTLARFGIISLFLLIWMFNTIYKLYIRPYRHRPEYIFVLTTFALNIVQCFVNTISIEIVFVFFIPVIMSITSQETNVVSD